MGARISSPMEAAATSDPSGGNMGLFDSITSGVGALTGIVGGIANMNSTAKASSDANDRAKWTLDQETNLANTAHQREVKDLQAAGLNPILSGTGGQGAAMPTMAAAPTMAPQINMPDFMAFGQSLRAMDQADQKLSIDRANSASTIAKNLTSQQIDKADLLLKKQGFLGREMGTDSASKFHGMLQNVIKSVKTPNLNLLGSSGGTIQKMNEPDTVMDMHPFNAGIGPKY